MSRIQGSTDIALNQTGVQEAQRLAQKLSEYPIDIIYSSDLIRAKQTADIVAQKKKLTVVETKLLRETHFGLAEGLSKKEAMEKFGQDLWKNFLIFDSEHDQTAFPGGETRIHSVGRVLQLIQKCRQNPKLKTVAFSTHGFIIRIVLHHFLPKEAPILSIPNCVVYALKFDQDQASVEGPLYREE